MHKRLMFLTLTVLACGRSTTQGPYEPNAPEEPSTEASTTTQEDPLQACVALSHVCGTEAGVSKGCCGKARCVEFSVYDWRRCSMGNADGAYCYKNEQCQSLTCQNSTCVKACKAIGTVCQSDSGCCAGTFCDGTTYGYGPRRCSAPQVNGSSCTSNTHCQSGICRDYQCVSEVCSASGTTCGSDADCCGGLFCDNLTYAPVKCQAPRTNGSSCNANSHCKSGICQNYQCVANACAATGGSCTTDSQCCSGTFCDNLTYGPWQCSAPLQAGSYCLTAAQCRSQVCTAHQCQ